MWCVRIELIDNLQSRMKFLTQCQLVDFWDYHQFTLFNYYTKSFLYHVYIIYAPVSKVTVYAVK